MNEIIKKKIIDELTEDSAGIITKQFVTINGQMMQTGENHRRLYRNYTEDRENLLNNEPENIINAVMSMWGDEPTIIPIAEGNQQEE